MALTWKTGQYGSEHGYAGGMRLFSVHYATTRSDEGMYTVSVLLPGVMASKLGKARFRTPEEAKAACAEMAANWLDYVGRKLAETEQDEEQR